MKIPRHKIFWSQFKFLSLLIFVIENNIKIILLSLFAWFRYKPVMNKIKVQKYGDLTVVQKSNIVVYLSLNTFVTNINISKYFLLVEM